VDQLVDHLTAIVRISEIRLEIGSFAGKMQKFA
jgi:hypothetical protein